jgi:hypothetical protein
MTVFALVHSPSVGPSTWQPVATRLREAGHQAVVPSLLTVGAGTPPFWPRVAAAVRDGLAGLPPDQPVVLVAHSNAGVFVPVITTGLSRRVEACVFADATVPADEATPMAPEQFLAFLASLAGPDGRLPPWTDWWDEDDVAPMFPDEQTRQAVTEEQPRLPLSYYHEHVPAPAGWANRPCGYLMFSPAYQPEADLARQRGWPVRVEAGEHLHQVVDPESVAAALIELAVSRN